MEKKIISIILLALLVFSYIAVPAQRLSVHQQKAKTEEGFEADSWTAHLDQDVKHSENSFEEFVKKNFNLKVEKRAKGIYSIDKTVFSEISPLRIDVRAVFQNESGGTLVSFIFSPGYDLYFSNEGYKDEFIKAEIFVKNFVRFHYTAFYNEVISGLVSKIKESESSIKNAETKIDKLKLSIAENEEKIKDEDPDSQKLRERNVKSTRELEDKIKIIEASKKDILFFQEGIMKANESLKLVGEYK